MTKSIRAERVSKIQAKTETLTKRSCKVFDALDFVISFDNAFTITAPVPTKKLAAKVCRTDDRHFEEDTIVRPLLCFVYQLEVPCCFFFVT